MESEEKREKAMENKYILSGGAGAFDCRDFDHGIHSGRIYSYFGIGNYIDRSSGGSGGGCHGSGGRGNIGNGFRNHQLYPMLWHEPFWRHAIRHQSSLDLFGLRSYQGIDGLADRVALSGLSQGQPLKENISDPCKFMLSIVEHLVFYGDIDPVFLPERVYSRNCKGDGSRKSLSFHFVVCRD